MYPSHLYIFLYISLDSDREREFGQVLCMYACHGNNSLNWLKYVHVNIYFTCTGDQILKIMKDVINKAPKQASCFTQASCNYEVFVNGFS